MKKQDKIKQSLMHIETLKIDNTSSVMSKVYVNQTEKNFSSNYISTSKYNWDNALPKIMIEQFSKMTNVYFLIITILQVIDEISISLGKPVILLPILIVVLVNGFKDYYEDLQRKKQDNIENNSFCRVLNTHTQMFEENKWKTIRNGSLLLVKENEYFPCDMIILNTNKDNGICYIETKNLDGETNLKTKKSSTDLKNIFKSDEDYSLLKGEILTSPPNHLIYQFSAIFNYTNSGNYDKKLNVKVEDTYMNMCSSMITINNKNSNNSILNNNLQETMLNSNYNSNNNKKCYFDKDNFVMRGCSLKQTKYIVGIAVYLGHDTKIMKNFPSPCLKYSRIEKKLQWLIIFILIIQFFLSSIGAICCITSSLKDKGYLKNIIGEDPETISIGYYFIFRMCTWILIFTNLVPISMLLSLDIIKYCQAMFIYWDAKLYDREKKLNTSVNTSTLNEELGQIKFIFTDKTGTLTQNIMKFKGMAIGDKIFGIDIKSADEKRNSITSSKTNNDNCGDKGILIFEKVQSTYSHIDTNKININSSNFNTFEDNNLTILSESVNFSDPLYKKSLDDLKESYLRNDYESIKNDIDLFNNHEFLKCCAICHSVFAESVNENQDYLASSPDELAIVNATKEFGIQFIHSSANKIILKVFGKTVEVKVVGVLEYSSERKRMTIIIKNEFEEYVLYTKGSDDIILNNCISKDNAQTSRTIIENHDDEDNINNKNIDNTQPINSHSTQKMQISEFSKLGLRSLVFARKTLSSQDIEQFKFLRQQAFECLDENAKNHNIEKAFSFLEKDLIYIGVSAVEDNLQEEVPETLKLFKEIGIKVWMLTGDKSDLARNIGFSSGLLNSHMTIFDLTGSGNSKESVLTFKLNEFSTIIDEDEQIKNQKLIGNVTDDNILGIDDIHNEIKTYNKLEDNKNEDNDNKYKTYNKSEDNKNDDSKFAITISSDVLTRILENTKLRNLVSQLLITLTLLLFLNNC